MKAALIVAVAVAAAEFGSAFNVSVIRPYNVSDVTVSGVSSGGYMAVQMHIAHSSIISGCAAFAAGPYYCAESNAFFAEHKCMAIDAGVPKVESLVAFTYANAEILLVDSPLHLRNDRVYLFSGTADSSVDPIVVGALRSYYSHFMESSSIISDFDEPAEHCFPTLDFGSPCLKGGSPYIGNCSFDGAGRALSTLLGGDLNPPVESKAENLFRFSQVPFYSLDRQEFSSLAEYGYIYLPTKCQSGVTSCHLHFSFHGCLQSEQDIGNKFATSTGYNVWAESNNIIVVYPYVKASSFPLNPNGCWDWWAYSGFDYGVKTGPQIKFVKNLIDALR